MAYRRIAQLRTADDFQAHLDELGIELPFDAEMQAGSGSPLAQPYQLRDRSIGNRFAILPMEGWDGTPDGCPNDLVRRRWTRFGMSGAKLIWGGEAVAVRHDGRANPNQLAIRPDNVGEFAALRELIISTHAERYGTTDDLMIGLQLTHSGRFCRPNDKVRLEPAILYHHPLLDAKFMLPPDYPLMTDGDVRHLIDDFVKAAVLVQRAGFDFVDVKHCHGYLGHEFLTAMNRDGAYGGSFENRTRFLREIVDGIRAEAPGLDIGVRLSAFDWQPFQAGPDGTGVPSPIEEHPYRHAFGSGDGLDIDLTEPRAFLDLLLSLDIRLVCLTAGSPYYNPHIQRPALFPPSDGYQPPEDPLVGVARQIGVTAALKAYFPELCIVGSGYSYLQEWLPNVAQHAVRTGGADFVGIGRMTLSYPDLVADVLAGKTPDRKRLCRTFSDCTTAPRNGMVSGCYPLDEFYKTRPEHARLVQIKKQNP